MIELSRSLAQAFLATVPLLQSLGEADIDRVADMVTSVSYVDGDVIMKQVRSHSHFPPFHWRFLRFCG